MAHTVAIHRTAPGPHHDLSAARQALATGLDVDNAAELLHRDWCRLEHAAGNRQGLHTTLTRVQQVDRECARSLFADLTRDATVPLDPDELLHMPGLRQHVRVLFGDTAVRCCKHTMRWMYDERDVRSADQALAGLHVDLGDVVDVQLPRTATSRSAPRRNAAGPTDGAR
ncbi:hypothetical protein [Streptomyces sp. NRRL S-37]|uniref:hypothetical protein n=1 Tax=Streptomyces sp. NRRL S-37 TaxID=1463903 RepID=UPI000692527B|nr:hypothetical protein [Streptomyces sp. NRRL S-37]